MDMSLLVSEVPAVCAAAFTTNMVKSAAVLRNIEILKKEKSVNAVITNSGNANACTGEQGKKSNFVMAEEAASVLGVDPDRE